ncbi:unnamed protein product [Pleuronectes platessa]|uniref:Uncharacterized protein n=1 Tax=Pleuronectes platessa TaxID=8262 RepID=A0A9N7VKL5_PLEPL|nr:unnamed protein product [Pleuronectes platessa]
MLSVTAIHIRYPTRGTSTAHKKHNDNYWEGKVMIKDWVVQQPGAQWVSAPWVIASAKVEGLLLCACLTHVEERTEPRSHQWARRETRRANIKPLPDMSQ